MPAPRTCSVPGCPTLVTSGRCGLHEREADHARGTRQERGYDAKHDALRRLAIAKIAAGVVVRCWRCGGQIFTAHDLHIGHDDHDRTITRGPEHKLCNLSAAGRSAHE